MKKFNNTIIIGIDHGYGNMKTANCCFPTGLIAYDSEPLFTKELLVYNGKYYLIGEEHKEYISDKSLDEDFYVLTLAAIAKELSTEKITEANIYIAAGLPLTWTSGQKADFSAYLMRNKEVSFTFHRQEYNLHIEGVSIYPQGYAAIAPYASKLTGVNVIADIGNGTMNVLYMVNGKPQSGKMFTEKFGTYQCTLAVREAFMQQTQRELNDHIIEEVLRTGKRIFLKRSANFLLSVTMFTSSQQRQMRSALSTRLCCIKRSRNGERFVRISFAVSFRRTEGKYGSQ